MKLSVIIPVYNEIETLKPLLDKVLAVPLEKEIIIVDDLSTDGTRNLLKTIKNDNITIIYHDKNKGKGSAIRTGLQYVSGDVVIVQDADLEYDPNDYLKLIEPIKAGKADVVYGSRFMGRPEQMTFAHLFGNKLLTWITNILYGSKLTDMSTCYKMIKTPVIKSIKLRSTRFEFCPEITAKLLKNKKEILEIPITYTARNWNEGKKITWKDGFEHIWALIKYRFTD